MAVSIRDCVKKYVYILYTRYHKYAFKLIILIDTTGTSPVYNLKVKLFSEAQCKCPWDTEQE